jgi:hypothetical protein
MFHKPIPEYKQAIITRLNKPAWKNLKKKFEKKYNRKIENLENKFGESKLKYLDNINAAVIDSIFITQDLDKKYTRYSTFRDIRF